MTCRIFTTVSAVTICLWFWPASAQDMERRISNLEDIHIDQRLAIIETKLGGIEEIGKGVIIAVGIQLILSGLNFSKHRRRSDKITE